MAVSDPTTIDSIAEAPDGRLLLVMTEDRRYADGAVPAMVEDLRQKMNAYVAVLRSGQLREMVGAGADRGADIRLYTADEPPAPVHELLQLAGSGLAADGTKVDFVVNGPPSTADLLAAIGAAVVGDAPAGWTRLELQATLVGDGLAGGLVAVLDTGDQAPMNPGNELVSALQQLKRSRWEPQHGTWVTFRATVEGSQIDPVFDAGEPEGGVAVFPPEVWAEELRRYPREVVPGWWPSAGA